jgi:hypothetical protein
LTLTLDGDLTVRVGPRSWTRTVAVDVFDAEAAMDAIISLWNTIPVAQR